MYEMKKMICMVMTVASLTYTTQTMAQSQGLQKKVNSYFQQSLKAQQKAFFSFRTLIYIITRFFRLQVFY